jgi:hypothetical protein
MFSDSRKKCEDGLNTGGGKINYLADAQLTSAALDLGINCALRLKRQLNTEHVELIGSLMVALDSFDETLEEWLQGGNPFSAFQMRSEGSPTNAELIAHLASRMNL